MSFYLSIKNVIFSDFQDSDRAAESPPCEVSSTTITDAEKRLKSGSNETSENAEKQPNAAEKRLKPSRIEKQSGSAEKSLSMENVSEIEPIPKETESVRTAVIAETSETVVIEGHQVKITFTRLISKSQTFRWSLRKSKTFFA